jgi:hypothetical protein
MKALFVFQSACAYLFYSLPVNNISFIASKGIVSHLQLKSTPLSTDSQ